MIVLSWDARCYNSYQWPFFGIKVSEIDEPIIIHYKVVCGWLPTLISFITVGNCFICQAHHQACLENSRAVIRLDLRNFSLTSVSKSDYTQHRGEWVDGHGGIQQRAIYLVNFFGGEEYAKCNMTSCCGVLGINLYVYSKVQYMLFIHTWRQTFQWFKVIS